MNRISMLAVLACVGFLPGSAWAKAAVLAPVPQAFAPDVPAARVGGGPVTWLLNLHAKDKHLVIMKNWDGDTIYPFWTFDGHVPGPIFRVRVGDTIEVHYANSPTDSMSHNVDFHAVSGPGGGSDITLTAPGKSTVARFKLLTAGLFVYHCAAAPTAWHIANGMYGMIIVDPAKPLPEVDHEYYVMQSEIYTKKPFGSVGVQE
ncbi:MAG: multicopper oxidase domain-containing protein, partial [bacterium]